MKRALRWVVSAGVSAGIVGLVLRAAETSAGEVAGALWGMGAWAWAGYALAQAAQGGLRAERYRLLLAGAGVARLPGRGRMFGVTLARNMFVDLLPMRAGELSYWALLNRGEGVRSADCASSMAVSVWLDFLALAAVLGLAVAAPVAEGGGRVAMAWGAGVVAAVVAGGGVALFRGPGWVARAARGISARAGGRGEGMADFCEGVAESVGRMRGGRVLGRAVGLSMAIRVVKYAGLGVAFVGVARVLRPALAELPAWQVLVGLIGGEGGAALPVPTFLSMGSYEAAGAGALGLAGVSAADAAIVLLGTHVASQVVDYAMGGLGLLGLLWGGRRRKAAWGAGVVLLVALALGAWGMGWRARLKGGAKEAPGAGTAREMGAAERAALAEAWGGRSGFMVWSSTMHGAHELVRMDWPSGEMRRLTRNGFVDSTPKISPEGGRVAFARSRREWVSFRNVDEWDVWVLDLGSGRERRVAERGAEPSWTGDGRGVVFHRGGREVVRVDVEGGGEEVLLGAREGRVWTGPSMDPEGGRVAVTVRGARRSTSLFTVPGGEEARVDGGCQLGFAPGGGWLVLVEDGGRGKTRMARAERDGGGLRELLDAPGEWSHEYFPRVSNDGALLAYGASQGGHEHDVADYEIFLWRIGTAPEAAARVSFHTGNDQWPDVWVAGAAGKGP